MRVLLVGAELEENLATRYLAACLERHGHCVEVASFGAMSDSTKVMSAARTLSPDLVGLSITFQRRAHEFGVLADRLRADGFRGHITCGGHFPTFAYRELLDQYHSIDTAVRHEGERTITELGDWIQAGADRERIEAVDGVAYRSRDGALRATRARALVTDLDALPFPKRLGEPQVHLGIPTAFVVGSRGCYGHCAFCCIHAYVTDAAGPRYRTRSAQNVAEEIAELRRTRGARMFVFHDDDFFTRDRGRDLARVTALRDQIHKRGVRDIALVVKARPDDIDAHILAVLREIGLLRIYLGIEAGCSQGLKTLGRGVDMATNRRALGLLRTLDVYTCYNLLIFDPDSTLASLRSSLGFWREHADVPMNFCRVEVYVGTPLMRRLAREGRLIGDVFGWDYEISSPAAERALRIFAQAFLDRNFRCDGLMNSNLGLGYHLHLLRHFYPNGYSTAIRGHVMEVIRRVNLDCIERMERILDFVDTPQAACGDAVLEFAAEMERDTRRANAELEESVAEATNRIMAAAREQRVRATPLWKSVAAATLALSPLACPSQQQQHVVDPVPRPEPVPPREEVYVIETDAGAPCGGFAKPPPPDETDETQRLDYTPSDPPPPPDPLPPPRFDAGHVTPIPTRHIYPPPPDPLPRPHRPSSPPHDMVPSPNPASPRSSEQGR